ncbi:MAG: MFS transporter [Spirochaetia bacterium]|nr:MFS transporter [Spirochaetia bacterium]
MTEPKRPGTAFAFTLLFLLYFFDYADRMVVNSLFPFLKEDWQLTDAQCGLLVSVVYGTIFVTTVPISILVDRWSRKKSIAIMAIVWSIATAACGFAKNFPQLVAARIAIGVGEAGYSPGGTAMVSGLFPPHRRSLMMGIWNAAIPLGAATGIGLGGYVAQHYGWRHAFGLVAIPGLIVSILFFFVKDYKTVELVSGQAGSVGKPLSFGEIAGRFFKTPSLLLTYVGFAANTFVTTALLTWLPTFFHRVENLPMAQAGAKGGAVMLLAIIGAPLGGFLADRWLKKRKNARPLFASLSAICAGVIFAIAFIGLHGMGPFQYAAILLGGLVAVSYVPAAAAVTQDVVHPGLRAVSYSLCVVVQNLLGSFTAPVTIGAVSDAYGIEVALAILPAFSILSGLLFLAASKYYSADLDHADAVATELEA